MWKIYSSPELQKSDANLSFSDHGGDSVDLLTPISEVGKIYVPLRQSDFMMKVLQYGITITPNKMFEIILETKNNETLIFVWIDNMDINSIIV